MNELRILITRLGWPSTTSRWWAMQELAARLGESAAKTETESALLQFLRSRKLEAEVVEVLCIFWMATQGHDYSPSTELEESIPKPSLLSDILVESCGLSITPIQMNLQVAPENFETPNDFESVQGADLPRIFRTYMRLLTDKTARPFLRQMAFEWTENSAAHPDAPYQADAWHFSRPLGDGFISQYSARAALRSVSAYLRTLVVAKRVWGMPSELANEYSLTALPVHPTLAFLKPRLPDWFPDSPGFDGGSEQIDSACRALFASLEKSHPGDELISFTSPVVISMKLCVEVSIVRWAQSTGGRVADEDLAVHLKPFWAREQILTCSKNEPLCTTTILTPPSIGHLMDNESKAWPLAGTLGFDRMGYLQHDMYPSRLYFPTAPGFQKIEVSPCNGRLEVIAKDRVIADFCYWNVGWGPARPQQLQGNCGTALISRGTAYRNSTTAPNDTLRSFYLWQVRTLRRDATHEKFSERITTGIISD